MGTLETSMFHPELVVKFESQFDEEIGTYRALVHTNRYPDNSIEPVPITIAPQKMESDPITIVDYL